MAKDNGKGLLMIFGAVTIVGVLFLILTRKDPVVEPPDPNLPPFTLEECNAMDDITGGI